MFKTSYLIFSFIIIKNFLKIYNFIQKYLINLPNFIILIGIIYFSPNYNNITFNLFSIIFTIFILFGEIKILLNTDKKKSTNAYYIKSYKKIYNKINPKDFSNSKNIKEGLITKFKHYKKYSRESKIFNNIQSNYIKPLNDDPISLGGDIFGYHNFVKNIYDIINGIDTSELKGSYSIGIVGEWGSGKSSIINLLYDDFIDGRNNYIFYKFNPWNYEKDNIVEKFLTDFSKILDNNYFSKEIKSYLSLLTNLDGKFKILNALFKDENLNTIKDNINKYLGTIDKKIIIVIDDLDRCEPEEVIMMLNIVKNLGDFKNVIYLVSYDKKHITKILEDRGFEGIYIDKIINIEKYLIKPTKEQLEEYFLRNFENILEIIGCKFTSEDVKIVLNGFDTIFNSENLRFIKKLLNHINLILQLEDNKEKILNFNNKDLYNLILINYVKLKDYTFFSNCISIFYSLKKEPYIFKDKNPLETNKVNIDFNKKFIFLLGISINGQELHGQDSESHSGYIKLLIINEREKIYQNIKFINSFS
ncbi:hypothetical protein HGA92_05315 [Candidatus Gracilibacteria bacterium]|nr:hypothetical protein [Candidatus Gracilibacteria bacterium]NUJ99051.1 hypothetical protein [Candidatus Gracilibacteria bacterium]